VSVVSVDEVLLWCVPAPGRGEASGSLHAAAQCLLAVQGPSVGPTRRPSGTPLPGTAVPAGSSQGQGESQGPAVEVCVEHRGRSRGESSVSGAGEGGLLTECGPMCWPGAPGGMGREGWGQGQVLGDLAGAMGEGEGEGGGRGRGVSVCGCAGSGP